MPERIKKRERGKEGVQGRIKGREKERQEERNIDYRKLGQDCTLVLGSYTLNFQKVNELKKLWTPVVSSTVLLLMC